MKKFFTVATMFALVVGFAACGGGDDEPTTPTPPSTEQPGDNPTDDPTDDPTDQPGADEVKFVNRVTSASTGLTLAATHSFLEVSDEVAPVEVEFAVFNAEGQNITDAATVYVIEGNISSRSVHFRRSQRSQRCRHIHPCEAPPPCRTRKAPHAICG